MWYWAKDGERFGPHNLADVVQALQDGRIRGDDLVWTDGMDDWAAAQTIAKLKNPPPLPNFVPSDHVEAAARQKPLKAKKVESSPNGSDRVVPSGPPKQPSKKRNFIIRHWNGQLPLAFSYWVIGSLLSILAVGLSHAFGEAVGSAKLSAELVGVLILLFLLFLICLTVWQLVGIWRSAGNSMSNSKRRFWPIAARVMVVIGAIRACTEFATVLLPMIEESSKLAFGIDDIPPYRLQLLNHGTEVELSGGMPFGTAAAFKVLIDSAPMIETVHLNSVGGRIAEGKEIGKIIRARELQTYTRTNCESACTLAFLGGKNRLIALGGRLGFHSASFGKVDVELAPTINEDFEAALRANGVAAWFVKRASSTPASSMWHPTHKELRQVGIITQVVNPNKFTSIKAVQNTDSNRQKSSLEQEVCEIITSKISKLRMPIEIEGFGQTTSASVDCSRKMIIYDKQVSLNSWEIDSSTIDPFKKSHRAAISEAICKDPVSKYGWGFDDSVYTKDDTLILRMQVHCKEA